MNTLAQRNTILELVDEAVSSGACYKRACNLIGIAASTLRRWRPTGGSVKQDQHPDAIRPIPPRRLSYQERKILVDSYNSAE